MTIPFCSATFIKQLHPLMHCANFGAAKTNPDWIIARAIVIPALIHKCANVQQFRRTALTRPAGHLTFEETCLLLQSHDIYSDTSETFPPLWLGNCLVVGETCTSLLGNCTVICEACYHSVRALRQTMLATVCHLSGHSTQLNCPRN